MVLKEAYRYQNYLDSLIREAQSYLSKRDFITTTKQTHNRKKANSDAEDEVVEVQKPYTVEFTPNELVDFLVKAIGEKHKLSDSIVAAKKTTEIDIDSSIAMNKVKQNYLSVLTTMSNVKATEKKTRGSDYRINAIDGNQVAYYYDVDEVASIDYDRNDVKNLIKKLQKETDEISIKLDVIQLTTDVNYIPVWELNTPLEDAVTE